MSDTEKQKAEPTTPIFVKDESLSKSGFPTWGTAKTVADQIAKELAAKDPKGERYRIRVRLRSRTDKFDVVVKTRKEPKA